MKTDVTAVMVAEHALILRMIALVEDNAKRLETGEFDRWDFFLDAVDFIRNYADRYHHAKEEDVLFKALVANGMPAQNSPVAAMLMAHDQGRAHVREMEEGARQAIAGGAAPVAEIVRHAQAYALLLRDHIDKEDHILYPLAERILPEERRPEMVAAYRAAADRTPEIEVKYRRLVEKWESLSAA